MTNGDKIRIARSILRITQKDLAVGDISRNLISDIESNKVKLVPSKALLIYRNLVIISCIKKIEIDIEFDEILKGYEDYEILKTIHEINTKTLDNCIFDIKTLCRYKDFLYSNAEGIVNFFLLLRIAEQEKHVIDEKTYCESLITALDYVQYIISIDEFDHFIEIFNKLIPLAYKYKEYKILIHFSKIIIRKLKLNGRPVPFKYYFNLSLFNKKIGQLHEAKKYIEICIAENTESTDEIMFDYRILKCNIDSELFNTSEVIENYVSLISDYKEKEIQDKLILCYSNLIDELSKSSNDEHKILLQQNISELVSMIKNDNKLSYQTYLNIGIGYQSLMSFEIAMEFFEKSYTACDKDSDDNKVILLKQGLCTFLKLGNHEFISLLLSSIKYTNLSMSCKSFLLEIILIIFTHFENRIDSVIIESIKTITRQIKGDQNV